MVKLTGELLAEHEILVGALNAILTHGWVRSRLGTPDTGFCAIGAIEYSATGTNCQMQQVEGILPTFEPVAKEIRSVYKTVAKLCAEHGYRNIVRFNNAQSRQGVIDLLHEAITLTSPMPILESPVFNLFVDEDLEPSS